MRTFWVSSLVAVLILFVFRAGSAHAADERLLVVVESTPGTGVDPREVRQTVGAELGMPVVAPEDATAAEASNVLIVTVDKADIRMSLRGGAAGAGRAEHPGTGRPAPPRREIGWLAGNLARDQVSGIVAVPAARDRLAAPLTIAAGDSSVATEPPASASPDNHTGATVVDRSRPQPSRPAPPRWYAQARSGRSRQPADRPRTLTASKVRCR